MKHLIIILAVVLLLGCNSKREESVAIKNSNNDLFKKYSVSDTSNTNPLLDKNIREYMQDPSVAKHNNIITLICISFYVQIKDTLMSIEGFSSKPIITPQQRDEKYNFIGWLFYNEMPVLFYDNEKIYGKYFYNSAKLLIDNLKFYQIDSNLITFPAFIYKISQKNNITLIEKTPEYKVKL